MPNRYRRFEHHVTLRKRLELIRFLLVGKILTYAVHEEWSRGYRHLTIEVDRITVTLRKEA